MDPLRIYDYLVISRGRVMDAIRPLTAQQYLHPFSFGLKSIGSTLTHLMVSEWYYIERLEGRAVPPYDQWPIQYETPPAFEVVESIWRMQAKHVRAALAAERDWTRRITYLGFPDDTRDNRRFQITATAGDFLAQLALHEVHHRAQIMVMLRELAAAPGGEAVRPVQDIDYNDLMFERREAM